MKINVVPEKIQIIEPASVTICLSKEEAGSLASILGKVCTGVRGNPLFDSTSLYTQLREFSGDDEYEKQYKEIYFGKLEC